MLRSFLLLTIAGCCPLLAPGQSLEGTSQDPAAVTRPDACALDRLLAATQPATTARLLLDAVLARKHEGAGGRAAGSAAIAAALGAAHALVEFVHWRTAEGERITALILRAQGEPVRVDLGDAAVLHQAIATHLQLLARTQRPLDAASLRLATVAARRLSLLVLQPLESTLAGCSRVHFAPVGDLLAVPFDSLPTSRSDTLLLETLDVRLLHCGSELVAPAPPTASSSLLVVDGGTIDLPEASREARTIASAWERAQRGAVLQRSSVELATLAADVRSHEFIHLAGTPRMLASAASGAPVPAVASRPTAAPSDAALRRQRVAALELAACRLVVVSTSEALAETDPLPGAAATTWRAALRAAGARSSLLSAWPIDGAATRELMTTFWRELILGDDPGLALRRAKLARLEANRTAHGQALPGTWAGFQLFGHAGR